MNCPKCNEDIMSMSVHYCNFKPTNTMVIPTMESELRMTLMQLSETKLELTTVTEQRDAASAEFYRYHGLWDRATKQLETVMYQRDRLAEALKEYREALHDGPENCSYKMYEAVDEFAREALQSLTQPTEP